MGQEKKLQAWQLLEKAQSPNELKKKDALRTIATQQKAPT